MTKIIGLVLSAIFLTTQADEDVKPVDVIHLNGCSLKYTDTNVSDKPDNIFTLQYIDSPGVCRIQMNQYESTENYEKIEVKYYRPGTHWNHHQLKIGPDLPDTIQEYDRDDIRTFSFDARTKSFMYLAKHDKGSKLIRRRLNDTQFVEKFVFKQRYQLRYFYYDVENFAYDWVTENLFVTNGVDMAIVNLKKPWEPVYVRIPLSSRTNLVIHPNAGYLFYTKVTVVGDAQSMIYRTYLDRSNKTQIGPISKDGWHVISSLAIDYHTDRLYWCAPDTSALTSSNLEGTDIKTVMHGCKPKDIDFKTQRLISFDTNLLHLRWDKNTFKKDENFGITAGTDGIYQIWVYDAEAQKITSDNPCSIDNGGCEHYCLAMPNANATKILQRKCVSPGW